MTSMWFHTSSSRPQEETMQSEGSLTFPLPLFKMFKPRAFVCLGLWICVVTGLSLDEMDSRNGGEPSKASLLRVERVMWWHMPLNPAVRKQSQGDLWILSHLTCRVSFKTAKAIKRNPFSKEQTKQTNPKSRQKKIRRNYKRHAKVRGGVFQYYEDGEAPEMGK